MSLIYYLPGRGGEIGSGLGLELSARGYDLLGREIGAQGPRRKNNGFACLTFQQQVSVIKNDLQNYSWSSEALVVACSFGAYLLAHGILQLQKFPGKVLLISPVLGAVQGKGMYFKPPQSKNFMEAINNKEFPDISLDMLVGSRDEHLLPDVAKMLSQLTTGTLELCDGEGHRLAHSSVNAKLDHWLPGQRLE